MKMRAVLLLLTHAILAVLVTAQCNCGCSYPLRSIYSQPPPMHYNINPLCQPPPLHPSMMSCFHQPPPPQIVVPLPPPPKGCSTAKTTVQQQPMMPQLGHFPGFHAGTSHPPICVQSVYVGKKEDEDGECCKKKDKKRGGESGGETRNRRRSRRQRRRLLDPAILRSLLAQSDDLGDPSDPSDSSDPCDMCNTCNSSPRIVYIDNQ